MSNQLLLRSMLCCFNSILVSIAYFISLGNTAPFDWMDGLNWCIAATTRRCTYPRNGENKRFRVRFTEKIRIDGASTNIMSRHSNQQRYLTMHPFQFYENLWDAQHIHDTDTFINYFYKYLMLPIITIFATNINHWYPTSNSGLFFQPNNKGMPVRRAQIPVDPHCHYGYGS